MLRLSLLHSVKLFSHRWTFDFNLSWNFFSNLHENFLSSACRPAENGTFLNGHIILSTIRRHNYHWRPNKPESSSITMEVLHAVFLIRRSQCRRQNIWREHGVYIDIAILFMQFAFSSLLSHLSVLQISKGLHAKFSFDFKCRKIAAFSEIKFQFLNHFKVWLVLQNKSVQKISKYCIEFFARYAPDLMMSFSTEHISRYMFFTNDECPLNFYNYIRRTWDSFF